MAYDNKRRLIDPENRYPAEGLRHVEQRALEVLAARPGAEVSRTRDVIQLEWGGEEGIVAVVTAEALELRLPRVEWTMGSYGPALASCLWQRVGWGELKDGELASLLAQAQAARDAEFRVCAYCGERFPPDRMTHDACHGCASAHRGVVY